MTSADDFVLQLIQDKALVPPDIIKLGREQLVSEGVPPTDIDSKLIDLIVDKRYCKYEDITYLLSQEFNIPLISLQDIRVDESVLKLLPQDILRKYNVFPISSSGGQLEFAVLLHGEVVRVLLLQLGEQNIHGRLKFLVVLSGLRCVDELQQREEVLFFRLRLVPDVPDQGAVQKPLGL